jgi:hypothetical protein
MARLPTPGSDNNNWGTILNDFLDQVHKSDGTLKDDVVGGSTVQNNAITSAKIADGAITSNKLASGVASTSTGIRSLLICYAPPNVINAKYDNDYAAGIFSRYDDVVLGTGLEDPNNVYYASTTAIIDKVADLSPDTVIWGYIDCGVTTIFLSPHCKRRLTNG